MRIVNWLCALVLSILFGSASYGQITGTVKVKGNLPAVPAITAVTVVPDCAEQNKIPLLSERYVSDKDGNFGNVVVYIQFPEGKVPEKPVVAPAVLQQKGCRYVPHIIAVMTGQQVVVKNLDKCLHNVHWLASDDLERLRRMPEFVPSPVTLGPFKTAEMIKVRCDVHPWMNAWIAVLESPYFAVSNAVEGKTMGQYSIDTTGLSDGTYTLIAWQEAFGELPPQKVKVVHGKATMDFTFSK